VLGGEEAAEIILKFTPQQIFAIVPFTVDGRQVGKQTPLFIQQVPRRVVQKDFQSQLHRNNLPQKKGWI
jgi:hypothetical protein